MQKTLIEIASELALDGGQSLSNIYLRQRCREFRIVGLNYKGKKGIYATLHQHNDDRDWFHSDFDEAVFAVDRQHALFNYFKNGHDNIWKENKDFKAVVIFDKLSEDGTPINPIIVAIKNLQ